MYPQTENAYQEELHLSPSSETEVPEPLEYWELQDFGDLLSSDVVV